MYVGCEKCENSAIVSHVIVAIVTFLFFLYISQKWRQSEENYEFFISSFYFQTLKLSWAENSHGMENKEKNNNCELLLLSVTVRIFHAFFLLELIWFYIVTVKIELLERHPISEFHPISELSTTFSSTHKPKFQIFNRAKIRK